MKDPTKITSDLMFAPMVVAMRLPVIWAEAQSLGLPKETIRAATEKAEAFSAGIIAAQMVWAEAAVTFWPKVFAGHHPVQLAGETAQAMLVASLKPSSREVRSNFNRLTRSK